MSRDSSRSDPPPLAYMRSAEPKPADLQYATRPAYVNAVAKDRVVRWLTVLGFVVTVLALSSGVVLAIVPVADFEVRMMAVACLVVVAVVGGVQIFCAKEVERNSWTAGLVAAIVTALEAGVMVIGAIAVFRHGGPLEIVVVTIFGIIISVLIGFVLFELLLYLHPLDNPD